MALILVTLPNSSEIFPVEPNCAASISWHILSHLCCKHLRIHLMLELFCSPRWQCFSLYLNGLSSADPSFSSTRKAPFFIQVYSVQFHSFNNFNFKKTNMFNISLSLYPFYNYILFLFFKMSSGPLGFCQGWTSTCVDLTRVMQKNPVLDNLNDQHHLSWFDLLVNVRDSNQDLKWFKFVQSPRPGVSKPFISGLLDL